MKVFIRKNLSTPTGAELALIDENGTENVLPITSITKDGISFILPDNPSNRKYWAISKLSDVPTELTYKESKTLGPRTESGPRKKLEDYMTDEEKATIAAIIEKAKERREADKRTPLTPLEKARREYERKKAAYEQLLSEAEA